MLQPLVVSPGAPVLNACACNSLPCVPLLAGLLPFQSNYISTFAVDSSVQGTCNDFAKNPSITFRWASGNIRSGTLTLSNCGNSNTFDADNFPVVSVRSTANVQAGPWTCVT